MVRNYWEKMEDWEKDQAGSLLHHQDCAHICRTGCSIHSLLGQGAEKLEKVLRARRDVPRVNGFGLRDNYRPEEAAQKGWRLVPTWGTLHQGLLSAASFSVFPIHSPPADATGLRLPLLSAAMRAHRSLSQPTREKQSTP